MFLNIYIVCLDIYIVGKLQMCDPIAEFLNLECALGSLGKLQKRNCKTEGLEVAESTF